MKKWLIIALVIALAVIPFASAFAESDQINEQEQWFLIRMESNREYIQKLLDAGLISEEEAAERFAYLDERIAYVMENGFESYGPGIRRDSQDNYGWGHRGYGHGRFGGGFGYGHGSCH